MRYLSISLVVCSEIFEKKNKIGAKAEIIFVLANATDLVNLITQHWPQLEFFVKIIKAQ